VCSLAAEQPSPRARALAEELRAAASALIAVVERIEPDRWSQVHKPGEWSPGKDAEHVADAAALHLWHVRRSLGRRQSGRPPVIERARPTAARTQKEVVALLRACADEAARLIEGLTNAQLELAARPPRKPPRTVADIVARPLISHVGTHQRSIEAKLGTSPSLQ
jgi:uncharacterized damage-inducible protein DinB